MPSGTNTYRYDVDTEQLVARYAAGASINRLANDTGMTRTGIRERLTREGGIELRSKQDETTVGDGSQGTTDDSVVCDPNTVEGAARAVAGLFRYLNAATEPANAPQSLPSVPSVHRITGHLVTSVDRMGQFVEQLEAALRRHAGDPSLFDEHGPDHSAGDTVSEAASHLDEVRAGLGAAHAHLSKVQATAGGIGHRNTTHG